MCKLFKIVLTTKCIIEKNNNNCVIGILKE